MMSEPIERRCSGRGTITRFTKGGINIATHSSKLTVPPNMYTIPNFSQKLIELSNDKRDGFCGWGGLGGSLFHFNPELKIGIGYVPTDMLVGDLVNYKISLIEEIVADIVRKNQNHQHGNGDEGGVKENGS